MPPDALDGAVILHGLVDWDVLEFGDPRRREAPWTIQAVPIAARSVLSALHKTDPTPDVPSGGGRAQRPVSTTLMRMNAPHRPEEE
ncbi:hypothetical protein GCM10027022_10960 [Alpinimonas psychrophila]